jgi:hypothetical protein
VLLDVQDGLQAVNRLGPPYAALDVGEEKPLGAHHFDGAVSGHRLHVDQERDRLLIASLGEKGGGLGKDPLGAQVLYRLGAFGIHLLVHGCHTRPWHRQNRQARRRRTDKGR